MVRIAFGILTMHILAPILWYFLFESYEGDDIVWHYRNVFIYMFSLLSIVLCPILLTGIVFYARITKPRVFAERLLPIWVLDMAYTSLLLYFLLTPRVY